MPDPNDPYNRPMNKTLDQRDPSLFADRRDSGGNTGPLEDLWNGYSGKNQRGFMQPTYKSERPDYDRGLAMGARGMQGEYGNLLRAQMAGRGPSLAQIQLQQGREAAIRAGTATAASARGANVALAGRTAGQMASRTSMQAARDAAMLRAQEQLAAQQQFGALAQAQRMQDLQQRGLSIDEAKAQLEAESKYVSGIMNVGEGEAERRQKAYGGVASAIGGAFAMSDPRMKADAQPVGYVLSPPQAKFDAAMIGGGVGAAPGAGYGATGQFAGATPGAMTAYNAQPMGYRPDELNALRATASGQQGLMQQQQQASTTDPFSIDRQLMANVPGQSTAGESAYDKWTREQEKKKAAEGPSAGGALSGAFKGLGTVSDVSSKQDAYTLSPPEAKFDASALGGSLAAQAAQVQPWQFRYKPAAAQSQGVTTEPRVGVMANDVPGSLEENPIYAPTVQTGPDGLARVNTGQATMANIAVTSDLAKQQQGQEARLQSLEAALNRPKGAVPTGDMYQPAAMADAPSERKLLMMKRGTRSGMGRVGEDRSVEDSAKYQHLYNWAKDVYGKDVADDAYLYTEGDLRAQKMFGSGYEPIGKAKAQYRPTLGRGAASRPAVSAATVDENMSYPELERPKGQSFEDYRTGQIDLKEQKLAAAAMKGSQAKTKDERVKSLQSLANAMKGAKWGQVANAVSAEHLLQQAKERGVKTNLKEVKEALRNDVSL